MKRGSTSQKASEVSKKLRSRNADCDLLVTDKAELETLEENVFSNFHSLVRVFLLLYAFLIVTKHNHTFS